MCPTWVAPLACCRPLALACASPLPAHARQLQVYALEDSVDEWGLDSETLEYIYKMKCKQAQYQRDIEQIERDHPWIKDWPSAPARSEEPAPRPCAPLPTPGPRPAPPNWLPAADDEAPVDAATRLAGAKASAAAAIEWARTAAGREAAAEAAAERMDSTPAAQRAGMAEEWEWAAAAWHASHQALEAARQACPDAPAVREAEAAVQAAHALSAQRQAWRDG